MVCKKCGRVFENSSGTCPFCGVGQENQINFKKLENDLENLKIEDNTSSFYSDKNTDNIPNINIENILEDLEDLKIKEAPKEEKPPQKVELVSDKELLELMQDIKENKDLFTTDRSQYQYIPKKEPEIEIIDIDNNQNQKIINDIKDNRKDVNKQEMRLNDLFQKEKLYNPETPKPEKINDIELPETLNLFPEQKDTNLFETNYKKNSKKFRKEIIISSCALIIVTVITITFVYKFIFGPEAKFIKKLNNSWTNIQELLDKYTGDFKEFLKYDDISINSTASINTRGLEQNNQEIINLRYIENKIDKTQYYEYTNFNNDKTIFEKMFIMNNKFYVNQEGKTNQFYITNGKFVSLLNYNTRENLNYFYEVVIDSIKSNINNGNFKVKNVSEKYGDKNYKLKEYSLNLTNEV